MKALAHELQEPAPPSPIRFSVCTLVNDHSLYEVMLRSFQEAGFLGTDCEFIYIDNSNTNTCDAFAAVRRFLRAARGDFVIVCHQDVRLHDDNRARLEEVIDEITSLDPHWALLGNAGGMSLGQIAMRVSDAYGADQRRGALPARVHSLDENFIVVKREAHLGMSRDLTGFHLYGTELCMIATMLGFQSYVVDFHLHHACSPKKSRALENDFYACRQQWIEKHRRIRQHKWFQTPSTFAYVSSSRITGPLWNFVGLLVERPLSKIMSSLRKRGWFADSSPSARSRADSPSVRSAA